MIRLSSLVLPLLIAASLSACKRHQPDAQNAATGAPSSSAESASAPAAATAVAAAVAAPAAAPSNTAPAGKAFDLQGVSVSSKALPAFPYMATPSELASNKVYTEQDLEFDRVYVIAGEELRPVEGKVLHRKFFLSELKWSPLAAHRNYETALKALGATRVDTAHPADDKFVEHNGGDGAAIWKKMRIPSLNRMEEPEASGFEQWLIRTPTTNIWLSFFIDNGQVGLLTVEEKAMQQSVTLLPAAELSGALHPVAGG
jgi:hypothetical protein